MALASYSELLTELQAYIGRSDALLVARFPTFMLAAEARIYNGYGDEGDPLYSEPLRCQLQEVTASITITDGIGQLPADFLEQRALYIAGRDQPPAYEPPQRFFTETVNAGWTVPDVYTIVGTTLIVSGAWTGSASLVYYKRFQALTPVPGSHDLLTANPLIWLHGLLLEAHEWSRNDSEATKYLAKLRAGIKALNAVGTEQKYGGPSQMSMRIDPIG